MVFEDGNYRTRGLNKAVELIGLFQKGLEDKKSGNIVNFENVSGDVPFTELTSNQFVEGMKKIYDLEPLINAQKLEALALEKANASAVRIR